MDSDWNMNSIALLKDDELVEFRWTDDARVVTVHRFNLIEGVGSSTNQTLSVKMARAVWQDYMSLGFEKVATAQGAG